MKYAVLGLLIFSFASCAGSPELVKSPLLSLRDKSPVLIGAFNAETDAFRRNEGTKVSLFYYPAEKALLMQFAYEYVIYRQYWDEKAVAALKVSLARFGEECIGGKLTLKGARARRAYGRVSLMAEWQSFSFSGPFLAFPSAGMGYSFRDGSPYFLLLQNEAAEKNFPSRNIMSRRIAASFTLPQALALSALLDLLQGGEE